MIRLCQPGDLQAIYDVINDAAVAYRGTIPPDCWHEPYMSEEELRREVRAGVRFWGCYERGGLAAVMGLQHVEDVTLIRHAYTRTADQRRGLGAALLTRLRRETDRPMLVGTWTAASWAIRFYQRHGFQLVPPAVRERLLRRYWTVSPRQIEASVVLADARWFATPGVTASAG